ncbi:ATP-binding protein [Humitalea sp. 24SJ18S-53]|uniref:ATP-binding protein n=1 Tax=Humitalea sp. 24SJ18S-53 TaxID=3422307 RepID=UPI003D665B0B
MPGRPDTRRVLAAACLIGGPPSAVLLVLSGLDFLAPGPAALAIVACGVAALGVARLWLGNLAALSQAVARAAAGDGRLPEPSSPLLPAVAEVADGVARLARTLAERGGQVDRLTRADAAIVEALPDPLLVLSADRSPLRANAAARTLFGATPGNMAGGEIASLLRHPILAEAVDRALATGAIQRVDLVLPLPVARDLVAQVTPLDPPLADGGRLMVLLADRSHERAVEQMRADFVTNASHELRTPLASLLGFIETLRGPAEDDAVARKRFLGIMAEQAERMRRLIDDLLGLSRIELSEHQPPSGEADIGAIAEAEADAMAPILTSRRARLLREVTPGCIARPADPEQIAQVVRNLLENAIRHGREGGQTVLRVETVQNPKPGVMLSVADDGPGIAREHIPRLTERFYRVDSGRSRAAGGTGLGLAIVKHIVNRHRGQLLIESDVGSGAVFRVWLPAA